MLLSKTNQQILAALDDVVYGHHSAKVALINLVNRSKMRYAQLYLSPAEVPEEYLVQNSNCLLIGDSGTGKTHLVHSLAKICEFPLVCIDANQLAPTGTSEGLNASRVIKLVKSAALECMDQQPELYRTKDGTLAQTVVFIDEIDKLANAFESSGNWNKHVQANFLSLFENNSELRHLSFIFGGAFASMKKYGEATKRSIGFGSGADTEVDLDFDIEQEVIKYGLIPELLGRIHAIEVLDKLKKEDYLKILENFIIPKTRDQLKHFNITNFALSDEEREHIVSRAMKSSMGVRSMQKDVLKLSQELEFDFEWDDAAKLSCDAPARDGDIVWAMENITEED